jgi:hypothetical protein
MTVLSSSPRPVLPAENVSTKLGHSNKPHSRDRSQSIQEV